MTGRWAATASVTVRLAVACLAVLAFAQGISVIVRCWKDRRAQPVRLGHRRRDDLLARNTVVFGDPDCPDG